MVEEGMFKLKKTIAELEKIKGRHTELVSVYLPAGASLQDMINQLKNEQGTAENIKSKSTRKNVVDALEKAVQHLRLYKKTPENGLVVFSGNVAEHEGVSDIKVWEIQPPEKLDVKLYWCDQIFRLEPLLDMVEEKELYGLVVMDNQEAAIGLLKGKKIVLLRKMDSIVPGKTGKGGQSSQRFERVREGLINDWYKQIAEAMKKAFGGPEIKGILFGGPGPAKDDLIRSDNLQTDIKKKIIATSSTGYSDEGGLEELIERTKEAIAEAAVAKERELVKKFLEQLQKNTGLIAYGLKPVLAALEAGAVEMILVSESFDIPEFELQCEKGHQEKRFLKEEVEKQTCSQCKSKMSILGQIDGIDGLKERAASFGTKIEVISKDTREGEQLISLGGVGAMLRYKWQP